MNNTASQLSPETRRWITAFAIGLVMALIAVVVSVVFDHSAVAVFYIGLGVLLVVTGLAYGACALKARRR
ncbi:hypothetical protein [Microbacterium sp. LMI1-1-1.1]|uniref:hypothetical protein n=1 Tax=Microbacterium sp. LMI1-1-1.1 TaxID=3135223 RepID=UPI0034675D34